MDTENATREELIEYIDKLEEENKKLKGHVTANERYRVDAIALMSENFRLRRMIEIVGDERDDFHKRCEKAERGLYNLKKWIEINKDEYGGDFAKRLAKNAKD